MEVEILEDDVFFAELSKRISLLITDDDDDADFAAAAAVPLPGFASLAHVPLQQQQQQGASMLAPPAYTLFHHAASYGGDNTARAWHQPQQQCGSKGTGVFIPRSTPGSAHHKKGKNRGAAAANKAARPQAGNALAAGAPAKRRT